MAAVTLPVRDTRPPPRGSGREAVGAGSRPAQPPLFGHNVAVGLSEDFECGTQGRAQEEQVENKSPASSTGAAAGPGAASRCAKARDSGALWVRPRQPVSHAHPAGWLGHPVPPQGLSSYTRWAACAQRALRLLRGGPGTRDRQVQTFRETLPRETCTGRRHMLSCAHGNIS